MHATILTLVAQVMLKAHIMSMELLATPFRADTPQPFAFGPGTRWAEITAEIREQIPLMLQHRLTPPPRETYSLNRFVDVCCAVGDG
jgi:aarF domain-containing kinase